jgi:hypothetical protein
MGEFSHHCYQRTERRVQGEGQRLHMQTLKVGEASSFNFRLKRLRAHPGRYYAKQKHCSSVLKRSITTYPDANKKNSV